MAPGFDITNPDTWPVVLTADEVAAIYRRKVLGVKKSCQDRKFKPAPCHVQPYLWKKVDVLRDLEGKHGISLRRSA